MGRMNKQDDHGWGRVEIMFRIAAVLWLLVAAAQIVGIVWLVQAHNEFHQKYGN
jgi:hypothetical protein